MRFHLSLLFLAFVALISLGNRNGRAASQNIGNTGAPGDETIGGQPRTCVNCHGGGPILATLALQVLDANGNSITQYDPGQNYTAKVTISATGGTNIGYGFQMIALRDNGNTDLDGFSDPSNTNNFKIATISNGRTYAEHSGISTPNTFEVPWKAPAKGTGSVTFYAAGNGVNRNNNSSGDGADRKSLKLTERTVSSLEAVLPLQVFSVSPNPIRELAQLALQPEQDGWYQISLHDAMGRLVWNSEREFSASVPNTLSLDTKNWPTGVYVLRVSDGRRQATKKIVVGRD